MSENKATVTPEETTTQEQPNAETTPQAKATKSNFWPIVGKVSLGVVLVAAGAAAGFFGSKLLANRE